MSKVADCLETSWERYVVGLFGFYYFCEPVQNLLILKVSVLQLVLHLSQFQLRELLEDFLDDSLASLQT